MMDSNEKIRQEVEETLRAYDRDPVLEANPYLMSRIAAARGASRPRRLLPVMALKIIAMILLLLMNLVTVVMYRVRAGQNLTDQVVTQLQIDFQMDQSPTNY
jgi:hypothetical protein